MAHIKVKYYKCYCNSNYKEQCKYIYDAFFTLFEDCESYEHKPYEKDNDGYFVIDDSCIHLYQVECLKERDYKNFEYIERKGLRLGREYIYDTYIDYLEIDGEVLIDRTKEGE